jgi:hypothetical protein
MAAEEIHQATVRTPTTFGVPRDLLALVMGPVILAIPLSMMLRNWVLMIYAIMFAGAGILVLIRFCSRNPRAVHQWAHSFGIPHRLLAKQNLRGIQIGHR